MPLTRRFSTRPFRALPPRSRTVVAAASLLAMICASAIFRGGAAFAEEKKREPGTGTFKGVVTLEGKAPARELLLMKGDPTLKAEDREVCAAEDYFSDQLLVNEKAGNGVANVVVYLRDAPARYKAPPVPEKPVVIDVKGGRFAPHVVVLRCNQTLLLKNHDPLPHNWHVRSARNDRFGEAILPNHRPEGDPYTFPKPERWPQTIICDMHPFMKACYLPLEHPFAAVTDAEGKFEIAGLPPGRHKFIVWHEKADYLKRELPIEITADQVVEEDLSFDASRFVTPK